MEIKVKQSLSLEDLERLKKSKESMDSAAKQKTLAKIKGNVQPNAIKTSPGKFHLPVLHLNDPAHWPSQPNENRLHFTDDVANKTCLGNCCGVEGLKAGCCQMDPEDLEHVLGPVDEKWIKDTVAWMQKKGIASTRADLVIDWEEGKIIGEKFFSGERRNIFLSKETYPILRFQILGSKFACKFLNPNSGKCIIYNRRPNMCRGYLCQFVQSHFLVRAPDKPNTYQKLR